MSEEDDEAYKRGVNDGLKGGFFDDLTQGSSKGMGGRRSDLYDKGYKWGAQHRTSATKAPPQDTEESSAEPESTSDSDSGSGEGGGADALGVVLILAAIAAYVGIHWVVWNYFGPVVHNLFWLVLWGLLLWDCFTKESKQGPSRYLWAVVIVLMGPFGPLIYLFRIFFRETLR